MGRGRAFVSQKASVVLPQEDKDRGQHLDEGVYIKADTISPLLTISFLDCSSELSTGCTMFSSSTPYKNQNYDKLKRGCLEDKTLFEDPEFPTTDKSLFFRKPPPGRVEWKRPGVSVVPEVVVAGRGDLAGRDRIVYISRGV